MTDAIVSPLQVTIPPSTQGSTPTQSFWNGGEAPSFKDILDTINPLQHLPIISTAFQQLTGDIPSSGAKIIGGALIGGPFGLLSSIVDSIVQTQTGGTIADNLISLATGKPLPTPATSSSQDTTIASNAPPDHLSANQRAAYNAYVNASQLT